MASPGKLDKTAIKLIYGMGRPSKEEKKEMFISVEDEKGQTTRKYAKDDPFWVCLAGRTDVSRASKSCKQCIKAKRECSRGLAACTRCYWSLTGKSSFANDLSLDL